jgi:hypothetical protein
MRIRFTWPVIVRDVGLLWEQWKDSSKHTPIISRLYIYSIIFDPFLFFVLLDRLTVGFSFTLSRFFLFVFYAVLVIKVLRIKKKPSEPIFGAYIKLIGIFFTYAALAGVAAAILDYSFIQRAIETDRDTRSQLAQLLSYPSTRIIVEYLALALTLFHYLFMAPRMILAFEHYKFLIYSFLLLCLLSLFLGFLNFGSAVIFGYNLFPRHFVEYLYADPSFSGARFQGLAGEPRDAVGQLALFGVSLLFLRRFGVIDWPIRRWTSILILTILAASLTLSASGVVGAGIFVLLVAVYQLFGARVTPSRLFYFILLILVLGGIFAVAVEKVDRFALYIEQFSNIIEQVNEGQSFSPIVMTQLNNFYPLIFWMNSCTSGGVGVCFFGGGFGSSFALNSQVYAEGLSNPNSYISRLLPELGLVGFCLFLCMILWPLFYAIRVRSRCLMGVGDKSVYYLKVSILLLLATVLAHKSNNFYMLVVIVLMGFKFAETNHVPMVSANKIMAGRRGRSV